jgi:hypothetical protein
MSTRRDFRAMTRTAFQAVSDAALMRSKLRSKLLGELLLLSAP